MSKSRTALEFLKEEGEMPPAAPSAGPDAQAQAPASPPPAAVDGGEQPASHTGDEYEKYFDDMHDLAQKIVVLGAQIKLFAAKQEMETTAVLADINAVLDESDPKMELVFKS